MRTENEIRSMLLKLIQDSKEGKSNLSPEELRGAKTMLLWVLTSNEMED